MKWLIGIFLFVAVLLFGVWKLGLEAKVVEAKVGVNYAAKGACSCIFVSGRDLKSCQTDYPQDMVDLFQFDVINWRTTKDVTIGGEHRTINASEQAVEVSVLNGLFKARAVHTPGRGCALE